MLNHARCRTPEGSSEVRCVQGARYFSLSGGMHLFVTPEREKYRDPWKIKCPPLSGLNERSWA